MMKKKRGLARLKIDGQTQRIREIASLGGQAAHRKGTAHEFTPSEAKKAGKKGGIAVRDEYGGHFYQQIGKKGGQARADRIAESKMRESNQATWDWLDKYWN